MAGKIIADQIQSTTAGTVDTKYVVDGTLKAWCSANSAGTNIHESLNISSLTDTSAGKQALNFTKSFSGQYYLANANANSSQNDWGHAGSISKTTSSCDTSAYDAGGSYQDNAMSTVLNGALA